MRPTTTADSTRSLRCLGNSLPRLGSPTWWPARPMRCSPRDTAPGDDTWMTRSTAPMSMPSSSELVATRPLSSPRLSSSSICSRRSRDSEPWWALTTSWPGSGGRPSASAARFSPSAASSLSRVASRSARRRALTKMRVDRCCCTSSSRRGWMEGQMLRRAGDAAAGPSAGVVDQLAQRPHVLDGDDHLDLEGLADAGVDDGDRPRHPPGGRPGRPRGASSTGGSRPGSGRSRRAGAGWPTGRCAGAGARTASSSRSRLRARCEPRLVGARAWISSTMTASTLRNVSRAADVSMR